MNLPWLIDGVWNFKRWQYFPPPEIQPFWLDDIVEYVLTKLFLL